MRPQRAQAEDVVEPAPEPIGAPQGISTSAAGLEQALGDDEILRHIGKHLEAVAAQNAGRLDQAEHVGLQRVGLADHLELDPGRAEKLARHLAPS